MKALAEKVLGRLHFNLEQVQDLTPTPMTLSSVMFYTGENPYTHEAVYVARSQEEKRRQKSYFFSRPTEAPGSVRQGGFGKRVEEGARSKGQPLHPGSGKRFSGPAGAWAGKRLTEPEEARNRSEKHDTSPAGARAGKRLTGPEEGRNRSEERSSRGKGAAQGKGGAQRRGPGLKSPALKKR